MKSIRFLVLIFIVFIISCNQNKEEITEKGLELLEDEKYQEAIDQFNKLIEIDENDTNAYYHRGMSYFYQNLSHRAILDFDKVITLNKNAINSYYFKGICNADLKKYIEAIQDLSVYIENIQDNKFAYFYRAASYVEINEYENALIDYFKVIELDSSYAEAYYMIGQIKYGLKIKDEGCAYIAQAMEIGHKLAEDFYYKNCVTYFNVKLVRIWNDYGYAHIALEVKNRFGKHIDKLWIQAELRDKEGNYLAGKESIHYDNIRPDAVSVEEQGWTNTNVYNIGEIKLTPYLLEIEGQDYKFEIQYFKILENKFGIKVTF